MSKKPFIEPHSEKKQKQYERSARLQYGPETVNESIQRWNSYSKAEQERIMQESGQVYEAIAAAIPAVLATWTTPVPSAPPPPTSITPFAPAAAV